ncbi:CLUMA_CG018127, isoform A [Clunio marinus]|uniref:CLUMA_CG018127, isoform A n=1 Tax=Clunio marinus TaxID=568069 RepID=A0A1J1IXY8_9DIPT|nr:CLUMA_CG018127, isoform A [Clunio marinus]
MEKSKFMIKEYSLKLISSEISTTNLLKNLIKCAETFITNKEIQGLSEALEGIFYNGLRLDKHGIPNIRRVFGIFKNFSQQSLSCHKKVFRLWLIENIDKGKLSNHLSFIFSDTSHIKNCYESSAFLRDEGRQNALMICISAIEANQLSQLAKIDATLFEKSPTSSSGHRRTSSHPIVSLSSQKSILASGRKASKKTLDLITGSKVKLSNLRPWYSVPNLHHESSSHSGRLRSKTMNLVDQNNHTFHKKVSFKKETKYEDDSAVEALTVLNKEDVPYFAYRGYSADTNNMLNHLPVPDLQPEVPINVLKVDDIEIHTDYRSSSDFRKTIENFTPPKEAKKKLSVFSFLEGTPTVAGHKTRHQSTPSMSVSPSEVFFSADVVSGSKISVESPIVKSFQNVRNNRKTSRQNLEYFLQMINSSSKPKVALDRENAHFHLSEAIIATSQHLKWNKMHDEKYKTSKDSKAKEDLSSTPKRQLPSTMNQNNVAKFIIGSVEDDSESSLSNDDFHEKSRTCSTSSEETDENTPHMEWNTLDDPSSAESIARTLMSRFKRERLPNPSTLLWLVNESQAPQQLLPFPDSFSFHVNPDDLIQHTTFIRGSKDWAPPRQQIIFTVHPTPDRKKQMLLQLYRCAGCGMRVLPTLVHTFRFCDYLGKYFCSACHKNQISTIPARVLDKWDFSLYPVSNFAYKLLNQIWNFPLFHIADIKPRLYEISKPLAKAREARLKLKFLQDFIEQCRFTDKEKEFFKEIPVHWTDDADIWSMMDFVDIRNNIFTERIQEIIKRLEEHILKDNCELCIARGFFCELCPNKRDVIFPWQNRIKRCFKCGSCYHEKCFTGECSKCERLKRRKRQLRNVIVS